ncbi:MAG: uracil-DNA glycosylase [Acidobacteriota bacterium]|nr:uracil-DNA glycosylase [Acidobacteriota bacterium]
MTSDDPRGEAARWLRLYRDLGVEEVKVERSAAGSRPAARAPRPAAQPGPPALFEPGDRTGSALPRAPRHEDPQGALEVLRRDVIGDCTRCRLSENRSNVVFGVGDPAARLMFVGEGPGADEDRQGEPFVGRAGQLLDRIIAAMGLTREQVYIANIVKCRPPENRNPRPDEAATCLPFLRAQFEIIQPEIIVTLGKVALEELLGRKIPSITRARGEWFEYGGIPVKATFHPAYLLRSPSAKRPVWEDMQEVMQKLGLLPGA